MNATQMKSSLNEIKTMLNNGHHDQATQKVNSLPLSKDKKASSGPKKVSAYQLFVKEDLQNMGSDMKPTDKMKKVAEHWKELSDDEKKNYTDAASRMNDNLS